MKKIIAMLLTFCMILSVLFVFSSCNNKDGDEDNSETKIENVLTEDKVKADPSTSLIESTKKTFDAFYGTKSDALETIKNALMNGSTSISLESKAILGPQLGKIEGILYNNAKEGKGAFDLNVKYNGKDTSLTVFGDKNGVILKDNALLNIDNPLGLNFNKFIKDSDKSELVMIFGADYIEQIKQYIETIKQSSNVPNPEDTEKVTNIIKEISAIFTPEISLEASKIGESEVNCIKMSFKLNNEKLLEAFKKLIEIAEFDDESQKADAITQIETIFSQNNINGEIVVSLNALTGTLAKASSDIEITDKDGGKILSLNSETTFESNKIYTKSTLDNGQEKIEADVNILKSEKDGVKTFNMIESLKIDEEKYVIEASKSESEKKIEYSVSASFASFAKKDEVANLSTESTEEKTDEKIKLSAEYSKETGDYTVALEIHDEDNVENGVNLPMNLRLAMAGKLTHTEDSLKFQLNSISADEVTLNLSLIVEFKEGTSVPAAPENVKDITDAELDELCKIIENIQASPLFEILNNLMGGTDNTAPIQ